MLTRLDETLRHQLPTTFDHAWTSDPRMFDRYWFGAYDPEARLHLVTGMGLYLNMNVLDGYVAIQAPADDGRILQHNVRVSRSLRPDIDTVAVGPLSFEIVEAFKHVKLRWAAGEFPLSFDLDWSAFLPPTEEQHHFRRERGRVVDEYQRYTQTGRVHGSVTLGDRRVEVRDWLGGRDHSWGVRMQTAGPEPVTGTPELSPAITRGFVFYWTTFNNGEVGGYVQMQMHGDGERLMIDGVIASPDGRINARIVDMDLRAQFHPGTRIASKLEGVWKGADGQGFDFLCEPLLGYWSMDGTGYDYGWNDGLGLGVWRGDAYAEHDVYDITHPEDVIRPDGSRRTPMHREAPSRLTINGVVGTSHQVFVVFGPCRHFGVGV